MIDLEKLIDDLITINSLIEGTTMEDISDVIDDCISELTSNKTNLEFLFNEVR